MYMYINVCINVYILHSKVESHYIYYLETCYLYLRMFLWIAFDAKRHRSPALSSVATRLCFVFFFFNRVAISMIEVIWSCFQFSAVVQKGGAAAP